MTAIRVQPAIYCPVDGSCESRAWWDDGMTLTAFQCGHVFAAATCRACGTESPRGDGKAMWCQVCEAWRVAR